MSALATFQDEFARAVGAAELPSDLPPQIAAIAAQPAFTVYRNTVMKGSVDALEANFPAVLAIVGEDWFRAAASVYARDQPPRLPIMSLYGKGFARFLTTFTPGADLPFLGPVAAIDRAWTEALAAADGPWLGGDALAGLGPDAICAARLTLHPSARTAWFETTSPSIWLDARGFELAEELSFEGRGEGLLIVRTPDGVTAIRLTAGAYAFLAGLAGGASLGEAAAAALADEPALNLATLTTTLLDLGAFSRLVLQQEQDT